MELSIEGIREHPLGFDLTTPGGDFNRFSHFWIIPWKIIPHQIYMTLDIDQIYVTLAIDAQQVIV